MAEQSSVAELEARTVREMVIEAIAAEKANIIRARKDAGSATDPVTGERLSGEKASSTSTTSSSSTNTTKKTLHRDLYAPVMHQLLDLLVNKSRKLEAEEQQSRINGLRMQERQRAEQQRSMRVMYASRSEQRRSVRAWEAEKRAKARGVVTEEAIRAALAV